MAKTIGAASQPDPTGIKGSVFVNNTSYAGCDIKLVANCYDSGLAVRDEIKQTEADFETNNNNAITLGQQLAAAQKKSLTLKTGTQDLQNVQNLMVALERKIVAAEGAQQDAEAYLKHLQKIQPPETTKVIAEAQSLTVSTFRDKQDVRALGSVYPKGFTRGPRSIAGTLVLTVFDQHALAPLMDAHISDFDAVHLSSVLVDQLPPIDITIVFANEYGSLSRMGIFGVEFVSEGQTMSVEDLITENVVNYVARDFDPMRAVGKRTMDQATNRLQSQMGLRASDLILEESYQRYKNKMSPYDRFKRRRNPFI